ncbi:sensor histidine kinase [Erysipelothrix anatis]|uniref:sensor histidine kinase n=1 Tax=Erysipelothrix anatis TaxID=2683713 RepID=UPI001F3970B3|nr:ATP-binding protein [Erysipelothrix anatis]
MNRINVIIFLFIAGITLYYQNLISIVVLIITAICMLAVNSLKQSDAVHSIRKHAEKEKKEAHYRADDATDKLVKLINAIPSPLVYINQRGDFEVSNQYFDQMLVSQAQNVYDVNIDSPIRQTLLDAFLNEQQFVRQFSYKDIDYQVLSIPLLTETRRYHGCMLIFQDVTRVVEGEKMQKRFIADASHELRTPITSIKGMVEIMTRPDFDDDQTRTEFLDQTKKEVERLDRIVEDLLLQSRLRANQVYLEKTHFNLKQFFEGLIYDRRQALHQHNIEVQLNCPSDLEIFADQFRISQVFLNLFNNAINYAHGGCIRIVCTAEGRRVKIDFSDDGDGISENLLPHIFERFYRGENSRTRDTGGSGLGLAISKSIIEAHRGQLSVASQKGKGTTFTINI